MNFEVQASTGDATRDLGKAVAGMLRAGDLVSLTGELGAGKTTFVQGAGAALGVTSPVVSPTFNLIREYSATGLTIYHVDVYRLERIQDVIDLGFEEMTDSGGITFVEWGDAIVGLFPDDYLQIELTLEPGNGEVRRLVFEGAGPTWVARWDALEAVATSAAAGVSP